MKTYGQFILVKTGTLSHKFFTYRSPNLKTKDLLSQLSSLEYALNDFSYEELSTSEAAHLKKSFDVFRRQLEDKIFHPKAITINDDTNEKLQNHVTASKDKKKPVKDTTLLIAQVSHEIRTPLNGIIGFSDLLKEDDLSKIQLERVNAIQSASYSLLEIINELLDYSKLSSGLENFELIDFQLNSLVNDVMYLCKTLLTNKKVALELTVDEKIPNILIGDPSKLSQVLLNLLNNAIKFIKKGSISLHISLQKNQGNVNFIQFEIVDTGIGISEENLKHIFDSFKQAENDTFVKYGGTGLGLSIVKQIIENQGGEIKVSSKVGKGTTFTFFLPFMEGNKENLQLSSTKQPTISEIESVKDLRVLVFEDNLLNQKLIEQRLKSWECITYVTSNGLYGLNILETHDIDVVLMDLKMPKMDGFEITDRIRNSKNKRKSQTPIIALTADFSIKDKEKCEAHKINDFILKPYAPDELMSKIIKTKKHMTTMNLTSSVEIPATEMYLDATKINLSAILEDCMGQVDLLEELIILYKQNALEFIGIVKRHLNSSGLETIALAAHKIKSGLAMMQSKSLHSIVVQIQKICNETGDIKHIGFLLDCFVEEYPQVEAAIEEQVQALKNNS